MAADVEADVLVIGAGPAGTMLAWQLAEKYSAKVALADSYLDDPWPNNYGVWMHEWNALESQLGFGLDKCLDFRWSKTDSYFGGEGSGGVPNDERLRIVKDYGRVNRKVLKGLAFERMQAHGVTFVRSGVGAEGGAAAQISHERGHSTVTMDNGVKVRARLVVDASGSRSEITRRAGPANPGFQIAYGVLAEVDRYPYDEDAMLFMDFRTDYLPATGSVTTSGQFGAAPRTLTRAAADASPTFLYAMPMGEGSAGSKKVFFEETNLVGRPPMDFDECRARLEMRLKHHGVTVLSTGEEENCYIPMGTALPSASNRVLALGGAAGTVHAATGYMFCRGIASSIGLAKSIDRCLAEARADPSGFDGAAAAAAVYAELWTKESRLQRDFCVFGGEYLMQQTVTGVRGFFTGFFALPEEVWMGFLSGWPGLPHNEEHGVWHKRLMFGIKFWFLVPLDVKLGLAVNAVLYGGIGFFRSVLPINQDSTFDEEYAQP